MSVNIEKWDVEDDKFWNTTGKKIANKNLWISIPALLLAFAVWIMWGMLVTYMKDFGFTFGLLEGLTEGTPEYEKALENINSMYYTLPAIAGLAGATLRLPNSFLIALCGGRNVISVTTALLIIPAVGAGIGLSNIDTSYEFFAAMALLSGFGGGNFSSSMNNISYFFPKKMQGYALGMNAGIGNLGVATMQKLIPLVVPFVFFGAVGTGSVAGVEFAGIQNAGWVWVPLLVASSLAAFFGMNCVVTSTPDLPSTAHGISNTLILCGLGVAAAATGGFLLVGMNVNMWIVLPVVITLTVLLLKYATPKAIRPNLNKQLSILTDKHNWIMTIIYTMTFGSFIGYSAAFPKLCQDIFPTADYRLWVFMGPMIGALVRPVGGIIADKVNSGAKVTMWSTIFQIVAALAVAYFVIQAREMREAGGDTLTYWWPFFGAFMVLFLTTGIGNGSTFRSIPYIFSKEKTGPVLGWTAAIAAYGAFIIPKVFGEQIKAGHAEYALYGFAVYYVICLVLNWWYYQGPKREFDNP
ncbi:MAG: NarK/NasA family nitrate transporter [Flavobacteriales bacterium]|nr:NarK/NasA family nitrate transporter [Flavobacteriales bacterium]MCB9186510.1 NarK/NasA family nitrate transporter [Flavobacteriales bacterium]